ncbi:TonB-dependent receptor [Polaribacter haliotis]|uniref:TonB-dependent receptor n=1 Tax=Polaribacter haliotis TaxID=1888915 RepID=A0A7L8AK15_9FLAO|nr:TonB-dependent receptor [Polaribacter haliotis]QOD62345.1 TonB-dependent receptor [Polaribacter haliotis]
MTKATFTYLFLIVFTITGYSQTKTVRGSVYEKDTGYPLPSANVQVKGTSKGVTTNFDGNYEINVKVGDIIVFSYLGFENKEVKIEQKDVIDVYLTSSASQLDEIILVGYGKQKKQSAVGAQSSIKATELKIPVRDLTTAIAGRLSGVVSTERGGGPGSNGANLFIRGVATFSSSPQGPLLVVDGVPDRSINNIDPEDIESFTILKDATSTAVYGTRGANGVILIVTKKGKVGKPIINVEVNQAITKFTALPEFIDGPTFQTLYNEAQVTRGKNPAFTQDRIDLTASGADPDLYPNVDWYDTILRDFATNKRLNISVSGGAEAARYYISAGYFGEDGLFKTGDVDNFNSKLSLDRFNFTSNVDVNITKSTKLDLGITGFVTNFNAPAIGVNELFNLTTSTAPHIIPGGTYSNGQWPQLQGTRESPFQALTQSGVQNVYRNSFRTNIRLTQELDFILDGLSATGMFAFDINATNTNRRSRFLQTYYATGRDADGNLITEVSSPGNEELSFSNSSSSDRRFYTEAAVNYAQTFGNHEVSGLLLFNQSDFRIANPGSYVASLPFRQRNYVGRATYGYNEKYFAEANFSYSGSDQFVPSERYGFFPSFGAGWLVSNEKFFKPIENIVSYMKLRYSFGQSGNAAVSDPNLRFLYLSRLGDSGGYTFGSPGATRGFTGFNEQLIGGNTKWETTYKQNLGIEVSFLNNDLDLIVELFNERREGILLKNFVIPYSSGLTVGNIPLSNVGKTKNKGIDITLNYDKRWSMDNFFSFRGTFNYNKNEAVFNGLPPFRYDYQNRIGQPISQRFGYVATGLFETQDEVDNAAIQNGDTRPGDIRYKDLNGDGIINSDDQTAIGLGSIPRITYGLTFAGGFKGFDASLFFQGVGQVDFNYASGFGTQPFVQGPTYGNVYTNVLDRWTEANPNPNAFYPRLSTNETLTSNYVTSTFWTKRADYIRLKQAEIGYTLVGGEDVSEKYFKKLRIFINGTNLLTFSKWDFWDPELGDGNGAVYPNISTYNFGLRLTF